MGTAMTKGLYLTNYCIHSYQIFLSGRNTYIRDCQLWSYSVFENVRLNDDESSARTRGAIHPSDVTVVAITGFLAKDL